MSLVKDMINKFKKLEEKERYDPYDIYVGCIADYRDVPYGGKPFVHSKLQMFICQQFDEFKDFEAFKDIELGGYHALVEHGKCPDGGFYHIPKELLDKWTHEFNKMLLKKGIANDAKLTVNELKSLIKELQRYKNNSEVKEELDKLNREVFIKHTQEELDSSTYFIGDLLLCNLATIKGEEITQVGRILIKVSENDNFKDNWYMDIETGIYYALHPYYGTKVCGMGNTDKLRMITSQNLGIIYDRLRDNYDTYLSWNNYKNKQYTPKELRRLVDKYNEVCEREANRGLNLDW